MKRIHRAIALAGMLALLAGAPAMAAQPRNQGCLGHDVSGYAQSAAGFVGGFVSGIASTTQGIGDEIQAHLAGQVPDTVLPNTCNNP